ncbi:unnamed protein product [Paramecium sonneborni]|uniref:Uncharacterized protein n=1 Tax=Paramecium sonneborni TaxID=65129 RepID=A0A8S1RNU1_9CILI|nr:unnamed protein product [Paramecium sonneborni]
MYIQDENNSWIVFILLQYQLRRCYQITSYYQIESVLIEYKQRSIKFEVQFNQQLPQRQLFQTPQQLENLLINNQPQEIIQSLQIPYKKIREFKRVRDAFKFSFVILKGWIFITKSRQNHKYNYDRQFEPIKLLIFQLKLDLVYLIKLGHYSFFLESHATSILKQLKIRYHILFVIYYY